MKTSFSALVICWLTVLAAAFVFGADSDTDNVSKDTISGFLKDFSDACSTQDIRKMESLFLPPDNTPEGENRNTQIEEMRKDWSQAKDSSQQVSVEFTHTVILVHALMEMHTGKGTLATIPVELKLSLDEDGYKIVSMNFMNDK